MTTEAIAGNTDFPVQPLTENLLQPERGKLTITELDLYRKGWVSVYITMTHWCNLQCPHCYDEYAPRSGLSTEQGAKIIEEVESVDMPKYFYDLSGGELMGMKNWEEMLGMFLATGKDVAVNTNGTLINEKTVKTLARMNEEHPNKLFLSVSLDSHDPETNKESRPGSASNKVFKGMELLKENDIRFRAAVTLTSKNIDTIDDTVRFILNNYTKEFIVGVIRPVFYMTPETEKILVSREDALDTMYKLLALKEELGDFEMYHCFNADGETFCEAGRDRIHILPDGNITACYTLQTKDQYVGNIYEEPLSDILGRMQETHRNRDNKYLVCENQHTIYGEPPHRLGKTMPNASNFIPLSEIK